MRTVGAALLATTMIVSSAFAATDSVGPLTPGKPAGVQKAQMDDKTLLWVIGAGLVIGGIVLVASGSGNSSTPTGSSSSSSSTP
jgi:hypothetical protein